MEFDLVFEGGGAKGIAFVGAIEALQAQGHTYDRLLGTSAGAITALFLAAGYTVQEMKEALEETDEEGRPIFVSFLGRPRPFSPEALQASAMRRFLEELDIPGIPNWAEAHLDQVLLQKMAEHPQGIHLLNFVERGGWYAADAFLAWLERRLDMGEFRGRPRRFSGMTLAELYEATGRELTVVAADTTGARMLVLNRHTAPDLPAKWAVRMSMSIPFLWEEVIWQPEWGAYRGKTDIAGHAIVDGGLLSNFPIELFISEDAYVQEIMGRKRSQHVLGFLIDESMPLPITPTQAQALPDLGISVNELATVRRLRRLVDTAMLAHDKMVIQAFEHLVVRLPAYGYGTTEFDMSPARRQALMASARQVTERYFMSQGIFQPPQILTPQQIADAQALRLLQEE
jgi:predicted acylesterase/phospholipase RssA